MGENQINNNPKREKEVDNFSERELKKFYKYVKTCKYCKGLYGSDGKKENGVCPRTECKKRRIKELKDKREMKNEQTK